MTFFGLNAFCTNRPKSSFFLQHSFSQQSFFQHSFPQKSYKTVLLNIKSGRKKIFHSVSTGWVFFVTNIYIYTYIRVKDDTLDFVHYTSHSSMMMMTMVLMAGR